jgi:CheY-like chemotaxis protein
VEVELSELDADWEIRVGDTGRGLSAEAREHLFEEFWQADSRGGRGLGLGLAIVKHLVERQAGTVEVESPGPGLGTTFRVTLPILRDADREAKPPTRSPRAPLVEVDPLVGAVVVVVDDYRPTALAFAAAFERAGATARIAGSVDEALVLLADSPTALISDIGMPDRDGIDLIRTLRGSSLPGREMPAIAVTAHAGIEDRQRIQRAGFDACLAKPVKPQEVVERLASLRSRLLQPAPLVRRLIVCEDERTRAAGICEALRAEGHDVIPVRDGRSALDAAIESGCDAILVAEPVGDPVVARLAKRSAALKRRPVYVGLFESGMDPDRSISDFLIPLREPRALQRVLRLLEDRPR